MSILGNSTCRFARLSGTDLWLVKFDMLLGAGHLPIGLDGRADQLQTGGVATG
jgi:hypothetical protein